MNRVMRSKLFVPGSRPELFPKALGGPADAVSFDLEDSVTADRKAEARHAVRAALDSAAGVTSAKLLIVRVNARGTAHFAADLAAIVCPRLDLVNLPKVEAATEVRAVAAELARLERATGRARPIGILATIESPRGWRLAAAIAAAHPRVVGLQLGFADLLEPLGIDRSHAAAIQQLQLAVRLAAGEAGRWACDAAYADLQDAAGFRAEALAARRLGYVGKSCLHPSQVVIANEVFQPTADEVARARRVVAAAASAQATGVGAFTVDGQMVDLPFLHRAQAIVAATRPRADAAE